MKVRRAGVVRQLKFVRRTKTEMAANPSPSKRPEEVVNVDGERFDAVLREVASPTSRRRIVGGVLGGVAALVAGTAVVKARPKPGGGKGKTKKAVCHFSNGHGGKYKKLTLGGPGADNHVAHHPNDGYFAEKGGCCPGDTCTPSGQCVTAACAGTEDTTGATTFACAETDALAGTECTIGTVTGACNGTGLCCDPANPATPCVP
jgi:hypothetical protein